MDLYVIVFLQLDFCYGACNLFYVLYFLKPQVFGGLGHPCSLPVSPACYHG